MQQLRIAKQTRESVLFLCGLIGLVSYVVFPDLRDPLLLPVYGTMMGLPIVLNKDKQEAAAEEKK